MLTVDYVCKDCGKASPPEWERMICFFCDGQVVGRGVPGIAGSRDNFGIKNSFKDSNNGKVIDNWKSWEKAGYRDALSCHKGDVKKKIKRKMEKIKKEK